MQHLQYAPGRARVLAAICALAAGALVSPASAMTLGEAYAAARANDAPYQAAAHELEASRQGVRVARAGLLPQVSLSYGNSSVSGSREFPNALNQEVTTRVEYEAPQAQLQFRTPLFNAEAWSRLKQVRYQSQAAESGYRARGLDLTDRLATNYLQLLLARSNVVLAESERVALEEQLKRATQRLGRGEGTRTEEATARASLEVARYREFDARDQLAVAAARLRRITGQPLLFVRDAGEDFSLPLPQPRDAEAWLATALSNSPLVQARQMTVEAARASVQRSQAGHLPRLDLVASMQNSRNESLSNLNQTSNLKSVGVQLSVPLFSGFGVDASVRQAGAELSRAEEDLRNERENVQVEVNRLVRLLDTGVQRVGALQRAVAAGEVALTGATRAFEGGIGTQFDVLDARAKLFAARRDLVLARNEHLATYVRLMAVAGEAPQRPIDELDRLLSVRVELPSVQTKAVP